MTVLKILRYTPEIHRLPNFIMLFQLVLTMDDRKTG